MPHPRPLAVISSVAAGSVHWGSLSGPALALRPLPYAVPT